MAKNPLSQFWLTCASVEEADRIGRALLKKRLVACAKQIPVKAEYWWKGKLEKANEVVLVMEGQEDKFSKIEAEVAEMHSYDTFVLESIPVSQISTKAKGWMDEELNFNG